MSLHGDGQRIELELCIVALARARTRARGPMQMRTNIGVSMRFNRTAGRQKGRRRASPRRILATDVCPGFAVRKRPASLHYADMRADYIQRLLYHKHYTYTRVLCNICKLYKRYAHRNNMARAL